MAYKNRQKIKITVTYAVVLVTLMKKVKKMSATDVMTF